MNAKQIWRAALGELQLQINKANYETWVRNTTAVGLEGDTFIIGAPTTFHKEWLERRLIGRIHSTLANILGREVGVKVIIHQNNGLSDGTPTPLEEDRRGSGETEPPPPHESSRGNGMAINPRYTFDRFIVGENNRLAHAACLAVADRPAQTCNPLFIYAGVGLGKTHLLHAIGHSILQRRLRAIYVSTEQFTNDLVNAIRERRTEEFRSKYRNCEILLVDDIHFIAKGQAIQEEFFHTFNALYDGSRQIVIASDRPPKDISPLEERLRSRFVWGLVADIQPPDLETRMAILKAKAEEQGITLPAEVLHFVARRCQGNVRELEGALNRIVALSRLNKKPITMELAGLALSEVAPEAARRSVTTKQVLHAVAKHYGLTPEALVGKDRDQKTAEGRHIAMFLMRQETNSSFSEIGRALGGRDHSTVLHGYNKIADGIKRNESVGQELISIREHLYSKPRL